MNAPGEWTPFFEYLASAAAALLGLVFVALQVSHSLLLEDPLYRTAARTSLAELASVLFFSLVLLMPVPWVVAGAVASLLGAVMITRHGIEYRKYRPKPDTVLSEAQKFHQRQWTLTKRVLIPAFLGLILCSLLATLPLPDAWPYGFRLASALLALWLLFSGLAETWWILFGPQHKPGSEKSQDEGCASRDEAN